MSRLAVCAAIWAAFIAVGVPAAPADELVTRAGKIHRGHAFPGAQETRLNPFGSTAPEMTLGVRRFRTRDIQEVRPDATAEGFFRQLMALPAAALAPRLSLLRWARTHRLRREIPRAAAEVLRVAPDNAEALEIFRGQLKWDAFRKGHLDLDEAVRTGLRRVIRLESGEARRAATQRLVLATGASLPGHLVERMARSLTLDRGVVPRVPLEVEAETFPGATYARFVPAGYDPLRPPPLLVALHGGGIMRVDGGPVMGSGRDALALFAEGARRLGWIVVAPTAVEGPWGTNRNEQLIQAVMAQVTARWNVDLERVHLAGHSGGGDGVWFYAARHADEFAGVGVAAAGEPERFKTIAAKSSLWIYHGDEDEIVPVEPVRKAAERLLRAKADFVYCELPNEKHGLPLAAERDWFHFAAPRRRRKAADAWPSWSHARKPSGAEIQGLGDPVGAWGETLDDETDPPALLEIVRRGHLEAEPAARRLVVDADSETIRAALREIVSGREAAGSVDNPAARSWAAWALGRYKDAGAVDALGGVLRTSDDALLLRRCAEAVGRIGSRDSMEDVRWALLDTMSRYQAIKGKTIPFVSYERACRLGSALARAMGRVGAAAEVQADLEETLVIGVLRDRRPVVHRADHGEDPAALRAGLAGSVARAYRALGVDKTLLDLLLAVVRKDPAARQAVDRGWREGLPPLR